MISNTRYGYGSVEDFFSNEFDPNNRIDQEFLSGQYLNDQLKRAISGREQELSHMLDEEHDLGINIRNKFLALESKARSLGYQLVVTQSGRGKGNEYQIDYVPSAELIGKNLSNENDLAQLLQSSIGNFNFSKLNDDRMMQLYGQEVINQGRLDYQKGKLQYFTSLEAALDNQLRALTGGARGMSLANTRRVRYMEALRKAGEDDPDVKMLRRILQSSIGNTGRKSLAGNTAVSSGSMQDMWSAINGAGSPKSRAIREGFINLDNVISSFLEEHSEAAHAAFKQGHKNFSTTKLERTRRMSEDLMQVLSLYLQTTDVPKIEEQLKSIAARGGRGGYLWNNSAMRSAIQKLGAQLHGLGAEIGTSQENSIANNIISMVRNSDLSGFGGLDDPANRKRLQTAMTRQRTEPALRMLREAIAGKNASIAPGAITQKKAFTKWDVGHDFHTAKDANMGSLAQYLMAYVTEQEVSEALKTLGKNSKQLTGAREGGVWFASDIANTINSIDPRSLTVSKKEFDEALKKAEGDQSKAAKRILRDAGLLPRHLKLYKDPSALSEFDIREFGPGTNRRVTIGYQILRQMVNGEKALGDAYDIKGSSSVMDRALIKAIGEVRASHAGSTEEANFIRKQFEKVGVLQTPGKLSVRNISSDVGAYWEELLSQLSNDQIQSLVASFNEKPILQNWLSYNKSGDYWTYERDLFKGEAGTALSELVSSINSWIEQGVKDTILPASIKQLQDVFYIRNENKDGRIIPKVFRNSSKFFGRTTLGQFAGYDSEGGVKADYRLIGALDRDLLGASAATGKDLSSFAEFLLGQRTFSPFQGEYSWSPVVNDKGEITAGGAFRGDAKYRGDYARWYNARKAIPEAVKWSVEESKFWNPVTDSGENDMFLGFGDAAKALAVYGFTPEQIDAIVKSGRYLNVRGNTTDSWSASASVYTDSGALEKSSWDTKWGRLLAMQQAHAGGRTYFLPYTGGFVVSDGERQISGSAIEIPGLEPLLQKAGKKKAGQEYEYQVPSALSGLESMFRAQFKAAFAEEQGWTDLIEPEKEAFHESMVDLLAEMQSDVVSKNGAMHKAANSVELPNSMYAHAIASHSQEYEDLIAGWGDEILDTANLLSPEDITERILAKHADDTDETYLARLKLQYDYLNSGLANLDTADQAIQKWLGDKYDKSTAKQRANALKKILVESVRGGAQASDLFKARQKAFDALKGQAKKDYGWRLHGLSGETERAPYQGGRDAHAAEIFAAGGLGRGNMIAARGAQFMFNGDFDGDYYSAWNTLMAGDYEGAKDILLRDIDTSTPEGKDLAEKRQDFLKKARTYMEHGAKRSRVHALYQRSQNAQNNPDASGVDINLLNANSDKQISAILSRLNKGYTGRFGNIYQNVAQALEDQFGVHSTDKFDINSRQKATLWRDSAIRGVFEAFTQDAISSKKIVERIAKRYGGDLTNTAWIDNGKFFTELEQLSAIFKDRGTYNSEKTIEAALQYAQDMKIFGAEGESFFNDRKSAELISALYTGEVTAEDLGDLLGIKADEVRRRFGVKDIAGTEIAWEDSDAVHSLTRGEVAKLMYRANMESLSEGGLAGIIRNAEKRPGGLDPASAPVYRLGSSLLTADEFKKLPPALQGLVQQYNALTDAAQTAAQAITAEGEAEVAKTTIAQTETGAIRDGTKAYKERLSATEQLEKNYRKWLGTHDPNERGQSVSAFLDQVLGNEFPSKSDVEAFEKRMGEAYLAGDGHEITHLEGYDEARFKSLAASFEATNRGSVADIFERTKSGIAAYTYGDNNKDITAFLKRQGITRTDLSKIQNAQHIINLFENALKDSDENVQQWGALLREEFYKGEHGAEGLGFKLGLGTEKDYNNSGNGDYWEGAQANRLSYLSHYGRLAGTHAANEIFMGNRFFDRFWELAGHDAQNLMGRERQLRVVLPNGLVKSGRLDALGISTAQDSNGLDYRILDIFDKKTKGSFDKDPMTARYAAQVLLYQQALENVRDLIQRHNIASNESWNSGEFSELFPNMTPEEFEALSRSDTLIRGNLLFADEKGALQNWRFAHQSYRDRMAAIELMMSGPMSQWSSADREWFNTFFRDDSGEPPLPPEGEGGEAASPLAQHRLDFDKIVKAQEQVSSAAQKAQILKGKQAKLKAQSGHDQEIGVLGKQIEAAEAAQATAQQELDATLSSFGITTDANGELVFGEKAEFSSDEEAQIKQWQAKIGESGKALTEDQAAKLQDAYIRKAKKDVALAQKYYVDILAQAIEEANGDQIQAATDARVIKAKKALESAVRDAGKDLEDIGAEKPEEGILSRITKDDNGNYVIDQDYLATLQKQGEEKGNKKAVAAGKRLERQAQDIYTKIGKQKAAIAETRKAAGEAYGDEADEYEALLTDMNEELQYLEAQAGELDSNNQYVKQGKARAERLQRISDKQTELRKGAGSRASAAAAQKPGGVLNGFSQGFRKLFGVLTYGFTSTYMLYSRIMRGIQQMTQEAKQLDQVLTNLQITTSDTRENTRTLMSEYAKLGQQLGASTIEVAQSALEWQRQGYDAAEVTDLVTSSLYLSKLGMIDAAAATSSLI